jgi:hypothetical protein
VTPHESATEALRLLQRRESVCRGRVSVVEAMKVLVEAIRVLIKAMRVPIVIVGEPIEAARVYNTLTASTALSQP